MISDLQLEQMASLLQAKWFEKTTSMHCFEVNRGGFNLVFSFIGEDRSLILEMTRNAGETIRRFTISLEFQCVEFISTDDGMVRQLFIEETPRGKMVRMVLLFSDQLEFEFTNRSFEWPPSGPIQFN